MILNRDHAYVLSYISRTHKITLDCILEAEAILATELVFNRKTNYNFCSRGINPEWLSIAVLRVICERHKQKISFDKFISTNLLDSFQIEKLYKSMSAKYGDGQSPTDTTPSPTCTMILGSDYATKPKFRDYVTT